MASKERKEAPKKKAVTGKQEKSDQAVSMEPE